MYRARAPAGEAEILPPSEERDQDDSPGEKFRKGTASRKVTRQEESDEENIDDSCEEIKSRAKRDKRRTSIPTRLDEDISRRKKTIDDSPRAARRRNSSHAIRSPYESGSSQKRATDISRTSKSRYRNVHSRDLPSRLRQPLPRAIGPPLSLKYDSATIPKAKENGDMDRAADVLLTMHGGKWEMWKLTASS